VRDKDGEREKRGREGREGGNERERERKMEIVME
jgi:hypothetical protein